MSADTEAFTQLTIKNKKESSAESFKSNSVTGISHEWINKWMDEWMNEWI